MRKLFLVSFFTLAVLFASAQAEQGNFLISGASSFGFQSTSYEGPAENQTDILLTTRAGYFVIDNLSAGLLLSYFNSSQGDFKSSSSTIGPWARYYIGGKAFVGAAYGISNSKTESGGSEFKSDGSSLLFEAGYPIFLGESAALEPTLNYTTDSSEGNKISSSIGIGVGFTLYL